ncbi:hypothetical protein OH77DRAFT_446863 [Trametes cingulata]|nr:hypothetical protein OH77DRAFT_446863 [Trametes cingulata]
MCPQRAPRRATWVYVWKEHAGSRWDAVGHEADFARWMRRKVRLVSFARVPLTPVGRRLTYTKLPDSWKVADNYARRPRCSATGYAVVSLPRVGYDRILIAPEKTSVAVRAARVIGWSSERSATPGTAGGKSPSRTVVVSLTRESICIGQMIQSKPR